MACSKCQDPRQTVDKHFFEIKFRKVDFHFVSFFIAGFEPKKQNFDTTAFYEHTGGLDDEERRYNHTTPCASY